MFLMAEKEGEREEEREAKEGEGKGRKKGREETDRDGWRLWVRGKEDKGKEKEGGKRKEKGRPEGGPRFSEEKRLREHERVNGFH